MICPNCGTQNGVGAKFCQECASPLAATCPNCGTPANPGAKFCSNCAAPLATKGAAVATRPAAPAQPQADQGSGAERRLVSILFADLVGFTPFAEERDAEDVRETLTRYFDLAREVIGRHGGTVEKFIGDAVMAVWGAPVAYEDDAERAVRTALELVEVVQSLGSGIQARAGVLTGEAAVTLGATNQGMVAGDIVNTASRLQSVAPPGTVLVGESTQRAAGNAIVFEKAGEQMLKGKEAPVAAWRALRVVAEVGGRNRAEALEAPFVGRQEEMRLLKDLLHTTEREKRLRVVSVIGPGGIGKSRLSWELLKYIDGLIGNIYWHSGRSPAYGEGISFWALGEMVRERAGLAERDDEATTRAKIQETVEQWVPDPAERSWIQPALLTLLGVEAGMASDQLFGAWRTFFERISTDGPVVLVFEDMHYADTGLLDFVDHLLEWSRGFPIYVVTLSRPDLIERRPDWGAGKRNFVSMYLEPLSEPQMRELLAGLVPGLPDSAVATIVGRADGIPLYAVEMVRTLLAEGRLVEKDGKYVPQGDLTTLAVPETLTALIAARLDTLDDTDRRIVHDAAVLGQSFTLAGLAAVADMPEADLEPRLASLVRRELLQRQMDPRSPERGQYAFVQALIREVAYNTLAKKDRKRLHLAAARYFESLGNDEIAGALASHYLAAHGNAAEGEEAAALAAQARLALKAATARAMALGSLDQAVTFMEQAVTVTADDLEQADLLIEAARTANSGGRLEAAERLWRQSLDHAKATANRNAEATSIGGVVGMMLNDYRVNEAVALIEPAVAQLTDIDPEANAVLRAGYARALSFTGQNQRALEMLESVLDVAEHSGLATMLARALTTKASTLTSLGRKREALGVHKAVLDLATENGLTDISLVAIGNLGGAYGEFDIAAAVGLFRDGIAMARRTGRRGRTIFLVSNFGYSGFLSGDWEEALGLMEPFLAEDLSPADRFNMLNNYIIIKASRGGDVEADLEHLRALTKDMSGEQFEAFIADPAANAAMAKGDFAVAAEWFRKVAAADPAQTAEYDYRAGRATVLNRDHEGARALLAEVERLGGTGRIVDARRATLRAGVAALDGRPGDALAGYREGLRLFGDAGAVWDQTLIGIEMAALLDPAEPEVAAVIGATREGLERLGATPYLEMLDAMVASKGGVSAGPPPRRAPVAAEVPTA